MANAYEQLTQAGAPAIVEPLFYRIVEEASGVRLEVRRRKAPIGSELLSARVVRFGADMVTRVAAAATEAVGEAGPHTT